MQAFKKQDFPEVEADFQGHFFYSYNTSEGLVKAPLKINFRRFSTEIQRERGVKSSDFGSKSAVFEENLRVNFSTNQM